MSTRALAFLLSGGAGIPTRVRDTTCVRIIVRQMREQETTDDPAAQREKPPYPSMHVGSSEAFLPVSFYFPGRSLRWIADSCRAGRIPGAVKVGRGWFMRGGDADRLVAAAPPAVPTEDEALADLRRRGVL